MTNPEMSVLFSMTIEERRAGELVARAREEVEKHPISKLVECARDRAADIEDWQRRNIVLGIITAPDPDVISRAAAFRQIEDLLTQIELHRDEFLTVYKRWLRGRR